MLSLGVEEEFLLLDQDGAVSPAGLDVVRSVTGGGQVDPETDRPLEEGRAGRPLPEGGERCVEGLDVVAPRGQGATQGEVDLVTVGEVDRVEGPEGVLEPAWPDLDPGLAQDAAEGDQLAHDGVAGLGPWNRLLEAAAGAHRSAAAVGRRTGPPFR